MPTDRELLEQLRQVHQRAQHELGAAGVVASLTVMDQLFTGHLTDEQFLVLAAAIERDFHDRSVQQVIEYIQTSRALEAPGRRHAAVVPDEFDLAAAMGRAERIADLHRRQGGARGILRGGGGHVGRYARKVAAETNQTVLQAGRRTTVQSALANRTRWRRITNPNPCAFCTYQAALTATYGADLNDGLVHYFHPHCRCTVTEAYGDWLSPTEQAQVDAMDRATQACADDGLAITPKNITAKMREHADADHMHDAAPPKTQTGGAGSGGGGRSRHTRSGASERGGDRPPRSPGSFGDPNGYPVAQDGSRPPFGPTGRPHISAGSRNHILQRHSYRSEGFPKKTKFPIEWSDERIFDAVDLAMAAPDEIRHFGDQFEFRRRAGEVTVVVRVRVDKPKPFIWTAYPVE